MKYYANYSANGTRMLDPLKQTNKKAIIKDIIEIAKGNRQAGSKVYWEVMDATTAIVASGYIDCNGRNHYTNH